MTMRDHFIAYYNEGEEANSVFTEEDAITEVLCGAILVAKITPSDGIWRDWTPELAQIHFISKGAQGIWPDVLLDHLDNTQRGLVDSAQGM